MIKSFLVLNSTDAGYRPENILVMDTFVPGGYLDRSNRAVRVYEQLLSAAEGISGIQKIAAVSSLPNSVMSNGMYVIEGKPKPAFGDWSQDAVFVLASPHYFDVLGIPFAARRRL